MYTEEQIQKALSNALQQIAPCNINHLESQVLRNYLDLLIGEFWQDEKAYQRVKNTINGMLLMKRTDLVIKEQKLQEAN